MFKIISNSQSGVVEIVADTLDDIQDLPTTDDVGVGSDCIVLEDSSVYMLGNDNEQHLL